MRNPLDELELERALKRAQSSPYRSFTRGVHPSDAQVAAELAARPLNARSPWDDGSRDPVAELTAMLAAREKQLDRLWEMNAPQPAVEDAQLWIEALKRELALAKAGKLPSVLDDLRS